MKLNYSLDELLSFIIVLSDELFLHNTLLSLFLEGLLGTRKP